MLRPPAPPGLPGGGHLTRLTRRNPRAAAALVTLLMGVALGGPAWASGGATADELPLVLIGIIVMLAMARLVGDLFVRLGQPAVLGELCGGMLIGNLGLVGLPGVATLAGNGVLAVMAELGVILLLFGVGLESNLGQMRAVGLESLLVACLGVAAPFALGWYVGHLCLPHESTLVHVFLGATLCATSVGLTARVMKDLGRIRTPEARIILGAAVIDDVLGLVILAAVVGVIEAAAGGGALAVGDIALIVGKAALFLVGALVVGTRLAPLYFRLAARLKAEGVVLTAALLFCFAMAWLAARAGLAPIVGAFAAGLLLEDAHFADFRAEGEPVHLEALIAPIGALLIPLFFVRMGMQVDLRGFAHPELLGFAALLTLAAVLGKQVCAFGVLTRGVNRLAVGLGMIPRGEVGLIFAATGAALLDVNGHRVINHETFSAVVLMVIVTTLATPPALKWALMRRTPRGGPRGAGAAVAGVGADGPAGPSGNASSSAPAHVDAAVPSAGAPPDA